MFHGWQSMELTVSASADGDKSKDKPKEKFDREKAKQIREEAKRFDWLFIRLTFASVCDCTNPHLLVSYTCGECYAVLWVFHFIFTLFCFVETLMMPGGLL